MKKIFLLLFITVFTLNATGFWTLTGLQKANVHVKNDVSRLKLDTIKSIKEKMYTTLKSLGIQTNAHDSPIFLVVLEDLNKDSTHYVHVRLALAEEVQTYRVDRSATFALTYSAFDFIDVELAELDSEVLESVDFLLTQFSEHFNDDKD